MKITPAMRIDRQPYLVIIPTKFFKAGCIVYMLSASDQGCASDDSQKTGIPHFSVTKRSDGRPPSATIPILALRRVPHKPRLWKQDGIWCCSGQKYGDFCVHLGNSPQVALAGWHLSVMEPDAP